SLRIILDTRAPVVNDIVFGPVTQKWDIAVRVPIVVDDAVRYILSVIVKPETLGELMLAQRFPDDWEGLLLDRTGRVIARTGDLTSAAGEPAPQFLRDAIARNSSGSVKAQTSGGRAVQAVYQRSKLSGWS